VLLLAAPAAAQQLSMEPSQGDAHRVGAYGGVEPGQAAPPPAIGRVTRRRQGRPQPLRILTWPGFTPLGDGGSRFFVQTTDPIQPEVRAEEGRVVLIFPNAQVHLRNSTRWLETRFFNTPVTRARLERRGRDMAFVLYLRSPAVPRVSTEPGPTGAFHYVYVDFPPGDYAPVVAPAPSGGGLAPESGPPPAPARPEDPSLRALDNERPPGLRP
jgi:hypothetical protein